MSFSDCLLLSFQSRLDPPVDKVLTGVKSLTLDTRSGPAPRKNQVKMISSCPLPHAEPSSNPATMASASRLSPDTGDTYSQITLPPPEQGNKKERRAERGGDPEPEYSLPFDTMVTSHQPPVSGADMLYDSIDEMRIRNVFNADGLEKVEHIYDEPEGCAAPPQQSPPPSVYDDPEEMRGDAWRLRGTAADPRGHEYPYDPRVDDYAVPKRPQRRLVVRQSPHEEQAEEDTDEEADEQQQLREEQEQEEEHSVSPYNNVMVKMV